MKGWGDGGGSSAPQNVSQAVAVESGAVSSNMDDAGGASGPSAAAAADAPKAGGFGRRPGAGGRGGAGGRDKYDTDTITDITEIPDVEEEPREADLSSVVAEAPNVRAQRVQGLQELQEQIQFQLPSALGDGIDLSLLQSALSPPENVSGEGDVLWEFEQLFADVSSEMMAEMEAAGLGGNDGDGKEGEDLDEEDENQGVAKGDGKKAAAPIRDRSNRPVIAQQQ
jgi:hypothetical protein